MTQKSPKPNFWASNFSEAWDITHWLSIPWKTHFCEFFILLIIKQLQARQNTNAEIRVKHWYSAHYKYRLKIMDTHIGNTGLLVKILTYVLVYSRNTYMTTHAIILSAAKDLQTGNPKPTQPITPLRWTPLYPSLRGGLCPTRQSHYS